MVVNNINDLADFVASFEGCRLNIYRDPAGYATIGFGHLCTEEEVDKYKKGITHTEAMKIFMLDLSVTYKTVVAYLINVYSFKDFARFTPYMIYALTSFTFNCGSTNLQKLCADGDRDIDAICNVLPLYNKAGGKVLRGLIRRRKAERELFMSPTGKVEI